jgi:Tol biopolymer transport system component
LENFGKPKSSDTVGEDMVVDCASVKLIRRTPRPWGMEHGRGWGYLNVLLLALIFGGCGGGSQAGGGGSMVPGSVSPPAIVFSSSRALDGSDAANTNGAENIWVVSADGTAATPVTKLTAQGIVSRNPVWSPDGAKIAFDSSRAPDGSNATDPCGKPDIWTVNVDGSHLTALAPGIGVADCHISVAEPAWSPDGLKLAVTFICCLDAFSNVAELNADGSNFTVLTGFDSTFGDGTHGGEWSPDGSKLIFDANPPPVGPPSPPGPSGGLRNVWVMNADGSGQTALTKLTAIGVSSFEASWSPDGSKVAFASARALDGSDAANTNGTSNIWVMNADGTGVTPLTKLTGAGASSASPAWSPGGTKLAFASARALDGSDLANAANNIWVMNADGSGATPLTKNTARGADSTNPKWRP